MMWLAMGRLRRRNEPHGEEDRHPSNTDIAIRFSRENSSDAHLANDFMLTLHIARLELRRTMKETAYMFRHVRCRYAIGYIINITYGVQV